MNANEAMEARGVLMRTSKNGEALSKLPHFNSWDRAMWDLG